MYTYDFDEIIDRAGSDSVSRDGFRGFLAENGAAGLSRPDGDFIRMWVADMELSPPPEVLDAIRARLDRRVLGYTALTDDSFYDIFLAWCETRYGWRFDKEELVFAPGIVSAVYQLTEELTGPDGSVVILTPSYGPFARAATRIGRGLSCSPLRREEDRFVIDFQDLERRLSAPEAELLILCNPHNPTGRAWSEEELRRLAALIEQRGLWVISDEIHCDLTRTGVRHIPLGKVMPDYPRLITCMSASKTFNLAGRMMSEIIIRDKDARRTFRKRDPSGGSLNPLSVEAHKAAFGRGGPWLEALHAHLDGNFGYMKEFFDRRFPASRFAVPEATYLAWADMGPYLPAGVNAAAFFAERAGVVLEDGNASFVGNGDGFVRLNLAMPRALVTEGLDRMVRALT